ncbi:hypothetical protein [Maridesulfovibrio sp.]|uniref:hypothetical protein n=1 Tax=Maridesulfovibrio sp. TaxID=2795000 RepID=UPI002A18B29E|nr:hypothetical protein [Maridesulfovibrio sp.]
MFRVLRAFLISAFFGAGIYLFLFCLSYFIYPTSSYLDVSSHSMFGNSRANLCWGRAPLSQPGKYIVLIGSSSARDGFRPAMMTKDDGIIVHSLCLGGSNISAMSRTYDLAKEAMDAQSLDNSIIATAVVYPNFAEDKMAWGEGLTHVDNELVRFGFYEIVNDVAISKYSASTRKLLITMLRPFFMISTGIDTFKSHVSTLMQTVYFKIKGMKLKPGLINEKYQKAAMEYWTKIIGRDGGDLAEEQFEKLYGIANKASADGAQFVLVDLPLPKWHSEKSPFWVDYQERKKKWINLILSLPGTSYLNMQDLTDKADYVDSAHPTPEAAKKWGARLRSFIDQNCIGK